MQTLDTGVELSLQVGVEERAEDEECRDGLARVVLIGAEDPIIHLLSVAAATGGDKDIGLVAEGFVLGGGRSTTHRAAQVAGVDGLACDLLREIQAFQWARDLR